MEKSILLSTVTRAQPEVFDTPKPISKFALKAKTTEYTAKLAKPREIEQEKDRSFPLKISKHALKAQIKDRTLELSKPNKPISTKFKEIPAEDFYEVKESAKNYVATQQIIVLSKPKLPITKKFK